MQQRALEQRCPSIVLLRAEMVRFPPCHWLADAQEECGLSKRADRNPEGAKSWRPSANCSSHSWTAILLERILGTPPWLSQPLPHIPLYLTLPLQSSLLGFWDHLPSLGDQQVPHPLLPLTLFLALDVHLLLRHLFSPFLLPCDVDSNALF